MSKCKKWLSQLGLIIVATLLFGEVSMAAPGTVSQVPLIISARADPNIMFFIDSSGSMNHIVLDSPYNPNIVYGVCPPNKALPTNSTVLIRVTSSGRAYFRYGGTNYDWGTSAVPGSRGHTGRQTRCFALNSNYNAALYAELGSGTKYTNGYGDAAYPGNYLNWYFGSSPTNWGRGARSKPDTLRRIDVAQDAANALLAQMADVRVGLSTFNGSSGARIREGIDDISRNRSAMISEINNISPGGSTPLSEALHEIGRYFVEGRNQSLKMHPDTANEVRRNAYTIFNRTPAYSSGVQRRSPIQYFCQRSFVIMLTDGLATDDRDISSSTGLQDYDFDCVNRTPACLSYDRKPGEVYESTGSDYLDDVAGALFDIDLRPDLTDAQGDEVKNNIVTYPIGFADPLITSSQLLDDTADNGGGIFLTANNSAELVAAFQRAAADIQAKIGSFAAVAFNTSSFGAGGAIYTSSYNTSRWSGNVTKIAITAQGTIGGVSWDVASLLAARSPTSRLIFTFDKLNNQAKEFRNIIDLTISQQLDLNTSPRGIPDGLGQLRINYLRGDRTREGSTFRTRDNLVGDIVNSGIVYVGKPEDNWPDTPPFPTGSSKYSVFKKGSAASRTPMIYVGDNAGFFHGFNGNSGAELFSYIPSNLFSNASQEGLHYLTDPNYQHIFYVDGTPTVADAYISSKAVATKSWRTVAVVGQRGGGRGISFLDITNPAQFNIGDIQKMVLGEFSNADDPDLGLTYGSPVVAMMNNGRFAAIFGNGYNDNGQGRAKLFIVFLDGGLNGTWVKGRDYIVLDTKQGSGSSKNGLATPSVVDVAGNGTADRIYAGDLFGNLWAFDVSSANTSQWGVAYGNNNRPRPLFNGSSAQPITSKPTVVKNPIVGDAASNEPNLLVLFGTGQYLTQQDKNTSGRQFFYGVWDEGTGNIRRNQLMNQQFAVTTATRRVMQDQPVDYTATGNRKEYGWYIDLPATGERVVTRALVRGDIVFFDTLIPDNSSTCAVGGTGWIMGVKVENGGEPDEPILDVNNDNQIDDTDNLNNRVVSGIYVAAGIPGQPRIIKGYLFVPVSDGSVQVVKVFDLDDLTGRISWREITGTD